MTSPVPSVATVPSRLCATSKSCPLDCSTASCLPLSASIQAEAAVLAGAEHLGAVGREDRGRELVFVASHHHQLLAGRVPHANGVVGPRREHLVVGADADLVHRPAVALELAEGLRRPVDAPDDRVAVRGPKHVLAVGTEHRAGHLLRSALELHLVSGCQLAHDDGALVVDVDDAISRPVEVRAPDRASGREPDRNPCRLRRDRPKTCPGRKVRDQHRVLCGGERCRRPGSLAGPDAPEALPWPDPILGYRRRRSRRRCCGRRG